MAFLVSFCKVFRNLVQPSRKKIRSKAIYIVKQIISIFRVKGRGKKMKKEETEMNQIQYAQQHLANERTYLAWVRTAIAIVGVGFLATSLHFTIGNIRNTWVDVLSIILGVFSGVLGIIVIYITNRNYKNKRKEIMNGKFWPSSAHINLLSILMIIFILLIINYFMFILWA